MRAASDLSKLHSAVQYRLLRLGRMYASLSNRPEKDHNMVIANSVIELDNMVLIALREFTISCMFEQGLYQVTGLPLLGFSKMNKKPVL
jgi:hypothetical protein